MFWKKSVSDILWNTSFSLKMYIFFSTSLDDYKSVMSPGQGDTKRKKKKNLLRSNKLHPSDEDDDSHRFSSPRMVQEHGSRFGSDADTPIKSRNSRLTQFHRNDSGSGEFERCNMIHVLSCHELIQKISLLQQTTWLVMMHTLRGLRVISITVVSHKYALRIIAKHKFCC